MSLQISGTVTKLLPKTEGTSAAGKQWAKQEFVLTTQEQYPKTICFCIFGQDRIDKFSVKEGETLLVSFDINSREYNNRYYTDVNVWNIERRGAQQPQGNVYQQSPLAAQQQANQQQVQQMQQAGGDPFRGPATNQGGNGGNNDLPF